MKTINRRWAATVAVVAAVALGAGVAYATIPDVPSGVFHGCCALDGGTLRVVDTGAGETCDAGTEVPLDWNVTGAQGPPEVRRRQNSALPVRQPTPPTLRRHARNLRGRRARQ